MREQNYNILFKIANVFMVNVNFVYMKKKGYKHLLFVGAA